MSRGRGQDDREVRLPDEAMIPSRGGRLGRFHPNRPLAGRWVGIVPLAFVVGSMVLHETVGPWPAAALAALGIYTGKRGLDSRGRGFALIALIVAMIFLIFYATRIIVGDPPTSLEPLTFLG
jgi:hypothetical protein